MKLTFRTVTGAKWELEVSEDTTIGEVKEKLREKRFSKEEKDRIKLILYAKILNDNQVVKDLNITEGSVIVVHTARAKVNPNPPKLIEEPVKTDNVPEQTYSQPPADAPRNDNIEQPPNRIQSHQHTPPPPAPAEVPPPRPSQYQSQIEDLKSMGFSEDKCIEALNLVNGDIERAINKLLNDTEKDSEPRPSPAPQFGDYQNMYNQYTPQQKESINRLLKFNSEPQYVIQIYEVCEHNENEAKNLLTGS